MIVSLYIIMLVIAVILFMKGMDDDAVYYQGISLILFLVLAGLSFYVTIPMMDPTGTIIEHRYIELGLSAFCSVFVFVDIIWLITSWFDFRKMKRGDVPYVPPGHQ
jgi:hypothetical protein